MDALTSLQNTIFAIRKLDETEWTAFSAIWEPFSVKRKTILTAPGETERYLYFVVDGIQRAFYTDESQKDTSLVFSYPPSFSGIIDSFLLQQPSKYYLETLTPSQFLRTDFQQLDAVTQRFPAIENWMRKALSHVVAGLLERQIELTSYTAEQKFRILMHRSPQVLNIIPHKYLASYLGLDPATFSKLLGTVRI